MQFLNEDQRIWDNLTDEEQGLLLLAWHKGLQIQYWDVDHKEWNNESHIEDCTYNPFYLSGHYAFRIKLEPVKEVHWCNDYKDDRVYWWYASREAADKGATAKRLAVIRREIVGGVVSYFKEDV